MEDLCVCCGATVPEGRQVCRACELEEKHTFMYFTCPECGKKLEIYHKQLLDYVAPQYPDGWAYTRIGLIYHCTNCGCDWDSEYISEFGDTGQSALKRHYWG